MDKNYKKKKKDILQNVTVYKDIARAGTMTDAMENRIPLTASELKTLNS
jgi:hypothetical protein